MRGALTRHVDPWHMAGHLAGSLEASRLPRLTALAPPEGALQASLAFEPGGGAGDPAVRIAVRVTGRCAVTCQRCLEALHWDCDVQSTVLVVADEAAARRLEAAGEAVVSPPGETLDLAALVEDEVMLAMPFAPRHPAGTCQAARIPQPPAPADALPPGRRPAGEPAPREDNPFAVLAALRGEQPREGRDAGGDAAAQDAPPPAPTRDSRRSRRREN